MKYLMIGGSHDGRSYTYNYNPLLVLPKLKPMPSCFKTVNAASTEPIDDEVYRTETISGLGWEHTFYVHSNVSVKEALGKLISDYGKES